MSDEIDLMHREKKPKYPKCPRCGSYVMQGSVKCHVCGTKVEE